MDHLIKSLLSLAETSNLKISFVIAGGGIGLFDLFKIEGCSRVLTEARLLYSETALKGFLHGNNVDSFVSRKTADQLAISMSEKSEADISFALTCALKTNRQRKGKNHGYLSICRENQIVERSYMTIEGESRIDQDKFITHEVLASLNKYLVLNE
ncbi:CinA family protein [bacterium]|nr:CinA family protein [bacterium]